MNFIRLYIGDYLRDTGTLTVAEHGAYVLMLLHHYATEQPLPTGRELHRLLRAESKSDRDAIDRVAARFWTDEGAGLVNSRAAREFVRADLQSETNRAIALTREAKKRAQKAPRTEHEPSTNRAQAVHEQSTNQTPDTRHIPPSPSGKPPLPEGVDPQTWADWLALRKAKKAPVTATVVASAQGEAAKAGMTLDAFLRVWCARGSQGLQAEWLKPAELPQRQQQPSSAPPIYIPPRPMTEEEKAANRRAAHLALSAVKRVSA